MEDKVHKIIAELDYGSAYIITYTDPDGEERCYDLWLDKEDLYTVYRPSNCLMVNQKRLGRLLGTARQKSQGN